MKKYFLLAMTAVLSLWGAVSCQEDVKQPPYPEILMDFTNLDFGYESDFKEITISTNREWTIESDAEWLAFDPAKGGEVGEIKDYKVIVTALENPVGNQRKATITVNSKAVYANAYVLQALNPDRVPVDFFKTDFGIKQDKVNDSWPAVTATSNWYGSEYESGYAALTRKWYAKDEKITIRNSSTSNSTGYAGASGLNHIHFGTLGTSFAVEFPMHTGIRNVNLRFGLLRNLYEASDNAVKMEEFPVWVSKDGTSWMQLEGMNTSPETPEIDKWVLCSKSFYFTEGIEKLYIGFCPTVGSAYRFDDLVITTSDIVGEDTIDWSEAAEGVFELGAEVNTNTAE